MDVTTTSYEAYELLVETEDRLLHRLEAFESIQSAVLGLFYKSEKPLNREVVEEVLQSIHSIDLRFQSKSFSPPRVFNGTYPLTGLLRCPQCGTTLGAHRLRDKFKDGTIVVRRYYVCNNFRNGGRRVCSSNSVRADLVEGFVFERLAEVV